MSPISVEGLRDRLHDANDELSVATMNLELLLEASAIDPASARSLRETLEACRAAGFDQVIGKPISSHDLAGLLLWLRTHAPAASARAGDLR